ncbi:alpha/beta hydrolase [Luteibacter yeojuensis]
MKERYRRFVLFCAAFAAISGALAATPRPGPDVAPITWGPCAPGLVTGRWITAWGDRLECGSMLATPDESVPETGSFTVGLVRVKAGQPEQREGSIFFNFGGPGANPLDFLPPTAHLWASRSLDHPLDGDKRRLADRFDLVAVVPRGLRGGTRFACGRYPAFLAEHDPTIYLADWNWAGFVNAARSYASSCGEHPLHPHIGTLQHVVDMEHARRALGEPVLHFVGTSYGTWVGAFYASMYPQRAGRIVLDSVMNHAGTFEQQVNDFPAERQAQFARAALRPALARPDAFGIGSDPRNAMSRFRAMPYQALQAWAMAVTTPQALAAVLTLADWVRDEAQPTGDHLLARLRSHVFSRIPAADDAIRRAAVELAPRLGQTTDPTVDGVVEFPVYIAVICGDTPWYNGTKALRALASHIGTKYPAAGGGTVTTGLICAHWPSQARWRPSLAGLAKAPPLLMIHSEFDPATPLTGAMKAFNASYDAYLVLARGSGMHGLFGHSATPCVEHAVGHFLLTGERPAAHLSGCEFVAAPPPRQRRDTDRSPTESEVRAELDFLVRHS